MKTFTIENIKKDYQNWLDHNSIGIRERLFIEEFAPVLNLNDLNALKPYLNCVDTSQDRFLFHQMVSNYLAYKSGIKFGFTDYTFNEYGWLKNDDWQDVKEFVFKGSSNSYLMNSVKVGKGRTDLYTIGIYYGTPFGGGALGFSTFEKINFTSFDDALIYVLKLLISKLSEEKEHKEIKIILSQVENKLKELTKIDRNNQISMF